MGNAFRRIYVFIGVMLALGAAPAQAVTLDNIDGPGFEPIYGDYAPGGDCSREPGVTIDASGFTFRAGGSTEHPGTFEYAASFLGPEYDGISLVFFPFPLGEYEFGRVILTVNADEQPGLLRFEDNTGPGDRFTPLEAALVKASTLQKCAGPADASGPRVEVETVAVSPWELVSTEGGPQIAYVDAASRDISSFSIFCSEGKPAIAMLLDNGSPADRLALGWDFSGGSSQIALFRSNGEATFWQAYLADSDLLGRLMREDGSAQLRIDGRRDGTVSLSGAGATIRTALSACAL